MLTNRDTITNKSMLISHGQFDIRDLDSQSLLGSLPAPRRDSDLGERDALRRFTRRALKLHAEFSREFPRPVFGNANWVILLACLDALLNGRMQCVKQIRAMLDESSTAVLRRIEALEKRGMIGRRRDPDDGRRTHVLLTVSGYQTMAQHLPRLFSEPTADPDPARH
ncbi:winged helix DNA-binding protein [Sphingomonas montanisoli]|uniref:Winged helix DNA-binding protein n=1 Tax=Sphingomonas montanisoli TaxID=2606412 RepID=A0A5D9C418_9SPHN|nr:winged helix DNA-binding protein [Sphingomonas montanisoli]TZG24655.1 winged helix DNA-binding protein [Sphingomonas montanisoli]